MCYTLFEDLSYELQPQVRQLQSDFKNVTS